MNRLSLLLILIAAILVVVIGPAALLSWRLGDGVRRDLHANKTSVQVVAGPLGIAGGRIARLTLEAHGASLDSVPLDVVRIDLRGVRLDVGRAFQGELVVRQAESGRATIAVSEQGLAQHLAQARGLRDAAVRLDDGVVAITGKLTLFNAQVDMTVRARLSVPDGDQLTLKVDELSLGSLDVPEVGDVVAMSINPLLSAPERPVPLRFTGVIVDNGRAVITAEVTP